ncbi:MAG TPA: ImmA/IrrE family metallo-endopeptidase [Edaphobacter sp.]|uniref:ImmA/IrrE family metallo-endopeptidase n=1 Tax=Edaphobacter sp. TaxID=1934404 RepID=UPI002B926A8F|nr:ImmA/IrrE family metallo-endopeptidase [Edaphobacter sp.]HUZ97262.1 ImmA/IrrE family metallo-endopeptidase [Edaphobacter sp.]
MNRVEVRPELLRWARERAGFSPNTLARRFPKLAAWEQGAAHPTFKQLEDFARATFTPVGFLFLDAPLVEHIPIPDFRTIGNTYIGRPSPDLLDTLYLCQQRQEWYRNFARTMGQMPLAPVGSARITDNVIRTSAAMRHMLGIDLEERRQLPTWTEALRRFIEQADALGVLVMVSGVVGSNNRRRLDPQEFRGFALSDTLAPLVFINGADTKAAQMFTLAHELAHVWLGQSAVSDAQAVQVPDNDAERWCNQVAAEMLVPLAVLRSEYDQCAELWAEAARLARRFKVSTLVILRRMHDAGGLTHQQLWDAYETELAHLRAIPRGSGGDFYLTLGARASKTFARALVTSTLEGQTSFTEAFRLLGFKKMATFHEVGHSLGVGF